MISRCKDNRQGTELSLYNVYQIWTRHSRPTWYKWRGEEASFPYPDIVLVDSGVRESPTTNGSVSTMLLSPASILLYKSRTLW